MAYDAVRREVLLFGGSGSTTRPGQDFADTWEWDGQRWAQVTPR